MVTQLRPAMSYITNAWCVGSNSSVLSPISARWACAEGNCLISGSACASSASLGGSRCSRTGRIRLASANSMPAAAAATNARSARGAPPWRKLNSHHRSAL